MRWRWYGREKSRVMFGLALTNGGEHINNQTSELINNKDGLQWTILTSDFKVSI